MHKTVGMSPWEKREGSAELSLPPFPPERRGESSRQLCVWSGDRQEVAPVAGMRAHPLRSRLYQSFPHLRKGRSPPRTQPRPPFTLFC